MLTSSRAKIIDCGDIPVTSYDNAWALQQIEEGHNSILMRDPETAAKEAGISKHGKTRTWSPGALRKD